MVFKMPKKNDKYTLVTMLFNSDMKLIRERNRQELKWMNARTTTEILRWIMMAHWCLHVTQNPVTGKPVTSWIFY